MGSLSADLDYYPITDIQRALGPNREVPMRMGIDGWWNSEDHYSWRSGLVIYSSSENLPSHGCHIASLG